MSAKHSVSFGLMVLTAAVAAALWSGCGYTAKTNLPDHLKTIYVAKVANRIDIAQEVSTGKTFPTYRPGLEVELRNAVNDRVIFDGHFQIDSAERADGTLALELLAFDREPLRYNANDTIQEFRVHVRVKGELKDRVNDKLLWSVAEISGDSTYFVSGDRSRSEDEAVEEALKDLSRKILEEILETW